LWPRGILRVACDALLDEFTGHVVPDQSAEELDERHEHLFERLGNGGGAVSLNALRYSIQTRIRPAKANVI
jgi:hypothetical protein